jgi:hypothetical protein
MSVIQTARFGAFFCVVAAFRFWLDIMPFRAQESLTSFRLVHYNGENSLVECKVCVLTTLSLLDKFSRVSTVLSLLFL